MQIQYVMCSYLNDIILIMHYKNHKTSISILQW